MPHRQLLRRKRFPDDVFPSNGPLRLQDDIAQHAAFLYRAILKRPYINQAGNRKYHGIEHMCNVTFYIPLISTLCDMTITDEDKKLLQLAALFHDTGREGDGEDLWDKDSAELLYHYLTISLQVSPEKAIVFAEAIANKDYQSENGNKEPNNTYHTMQIQDGSIVWVDQVSQKEKTVIQKLLHEADCFDVIRVRDRFEKKYLDFYGEVADEELTQFEYEVKQLIQIEMNPNIRQEFNSELCFGKILIAISEDTQFSFFREAYGVEKLAQDARCMKIAHRFQLPYVSQSIAELLDSLWEKIELSVEAKKWINRCLKQYVTQNEKAVLDYLQKIQSLSIQNIIEHSKQLFHEEHEEPEGTLFKSVGDNNWNDFAGSLANPEKNRPGVTYKDLRKEVVTRKPFTIRLNNGKPEIVSTDKNERTSLHGEKKLQFTKHQSTSFSNDKAGYNPDTYKKSDVNVGVAFSIAGGVIINRILMYGNPTYERHYDFDTREEAQDFLNDMLRLGIWHESLLDLQEYALLNNNNKINEIMAGFRWSKGSSIVVLSDNLESRLSAQLRAQDLKNRFEACGLHIIDALPITIYPGFSTYDQDEQRRDLQAADNNKRLKKYSIAHKILSGILPTNPRELVTYLRDIADGHSTVKTLNPQFYEHYRIHMQSHIKNQIALFETAYRSNEALSCQWMSRNDLEKLLQFAHHLEETFIESSNTVSRAIQLFQEMDFVLDKIGVAKTPIEFVDSPEKLIAYIKKYNKFTLLIKTLDDFIKIYLIANEELKNEMLNEYSQIFRKWISSINDIEKVFSQYTDPKIKKIVTNTAISVAGFSSEMIDNLDDFIKIYLLLNDEQKIQMLWNCSHRFTEWILSIQNIEKILTHCTDTLITEFVTDGVVTLAGNSNLMIDTLDDFIKIYLYLDDKQKKKIGVLTISPANDPSTFKPAWLSQISA